MSRISPAKLVVALLTVAAFARADYLIDDTNITAIRYSVSPSTSVKWGPFGAKESLNITVTGGSPSGFRVDSSQSFDGTFTYGACSTIDLCSIQYSFTGSGTTIFALQAGSQGINATVAVDGGPPSLNTLAPIGPPTFFKPQVQLFSVQSLVTGPHTIVLNVVDYAGIFSGMMLDYLFVNETIVAPPTTTSASVTSDPASLTSTPAPVTSASASVTSAATSQTAIVARPRRSNSAAAAAVGALGGLAFVAILIIALFYYMRRRKQLRSRFDDPKAATSPFVPHSVPASPYAAVPFVETATLDTSPSTVDSSSDGRTRADGSSFMSPRGSSKGARPSTANSSATVTTNSSATATTTGPLSSASAVPTGNRRSNSARPSTAASIVTIPTPYVVPATVVRPFSAPAQLTDEQVDFVNNLHRHNVPTAAIARVMERMMAGRDPGVVDSGSQIDVMDDDAFSQPPPRYE